MLLQQGKINNCSNKEFTFLKLFSWTTKHHPCRIRHFPFEKHLSRKKEQFTYLHVLLLPSLVIKRLTLLFYLAKSGVTVKVLIIYDNIKTFFFWFPCSLSMAICTFQRNDAHHWVRFRAYYFSASYYTYLIGGHKPVFITDMTQPTHTVLFASEKIW